MSRIRNGIKKLLYYPFKYGWDYDNRRYWTDRYLKYGRDLRGCGDEGKSLVENHNMYANDTGDFIKACSRLDVSNMKVLDVGCGLGVYTQIFKNMNVSDYTGTDITDVNFNHLRKKYPAYKFIIDDITESKLTGKYDMILMIDVTEHIIDKARLNRALSKIIELCSDSTIIFISPITNKSRRHLFHTHYWNIGDFSKIIEHCSYRLIPFRYAMALMGKLSTKGMYEAIKS